MCSCCLGLSLTQIIQGHEYEGRYCDVTSFKPTCWVHCSKTAEMLFSLKPPTFSPIKLNHNITYMLLNVYC